jgi:transposase-like protein
MREAVVNALLAGSTYRAACEAAGIPWSTWRDWSRQHRDGGHPDPDVDGLVAAAREAYAKATNAITAQVRVAGAKDWRAAAFLLDHRQGDPKARHDERRARWEAEIAAQRAKGTHVERVAVDGVGDELIARLRKAIHDDP